jgi:hypothetical protein
MGSEPLCFRLFKGIWPSTSAMAVLVAERPAGAAVTDPKRQEYKTAT